MSNPHTDSARGGATAVADARPALRVAPDWLAWLEERRRLVDDELSAHLKELEKLLGTHSRLGSAVVYSVRVGGKRVRPILVLETCRVCGGSVSTALPAALAMECIHTFSLIHDDLPAMDNDDLRRGQPTNHKVFGDALAILAGDWLAAHGLRLLLSDRYDRSVACALIQTLAEGTLSMIEGQAADIEGEGRPAEQQQVEFIHLHKTARLIEACCRMGAVCAGVGGDEVAAMGRYGRHLGLAFQIVDDLLDVTGSTEHVGKRVGKDAAVAKQTYPAAFGVDESEQHARREVEAALAALEPFGPRADRLRDLARFVITRDR